MGALAHESATHGGHVSDVTLYTACWRRHGRFCVLCFISSCSSVTSETRPPCVSIPKAQHEKKSTSLQIKITSQLNTLSAHLKIHRTSHLLPLEHFGTTAPSRARARAHFTEVCTSCCHPSPHLPKNAPTHTPSAVYENRPG